MTYYCEEVPDSRSITMNPPTARTKWVLEGEFESSVVSSLALSLTPPLWAHPLGLLYRQDVAIDPIGHKLWNFTVPYGQRKREAGSYRIEFDTMGGTIHVSGGKHINVYPSTGDSHNGLIGVNGDNVDGADIVIPAMKIVVHFKHPAGVITPTQIKNLSRLSGAVDTTGFLDWSPYETLFLGAAGIEGSDVETEIAYHFGMSENLIDVSIAGISGITKAGWDVAWIKWKDAVSDNNKPIKEAEYVNVVRVYKERALAALLGFG